MTNNNMRKRNWLGIITALLLIAQMIPVAAQDRGGRSMMDDPDRVVEGGGMFPTGWSARVDNGRGGQLQSPNLVVFKAEADGFHATMGPATTFYNPSWTKSGNYSFSARVTQTEKPSHPISYGIIVGGSSLDGDDQAYSYFLVRADREGNGEFFIATRKDGDRTIVNEWTTHEAIHNQDAEGKQQNVLGVQVQGNNVIFTSNGTEVARKTKGEVVTDGILGFRVTHNTDVVIDQVKR